MVNSSVDFLGKLSELLVCDAHEFNIMNVEIENLETDLRLFRAFLRDTVKKQSKNAIIKKMAWELRDVVYEIEDIIDAYVAITAVQKSPKNSSSRHWKKPTGLHTEVEEIKQRVDQVLANIDILSNNDEDDHRKPQDLWPGKLLKQRQAPRNKAVVGFEDVMYRLINILAEETEYLDIISVTGMLGLGKSTVAWKIFNDPDIILEFAIRIWVCISEEFTDREIFLYILKEFTTIDGYILAKEVHELADMVAAYLERGSFLIVMDDVRETADWDRLRVALPKDNTRGKVLITSRTTQVGYYVNRMRPPHYLRFLTFEESWELFRLEALGKLDCPSELEDAGRKIVNNCNGLPLSIVAIGGILALSYSDSNIAVTRKEWERVSKHVSSYLCEMGPANRMQSSISLIYDKLPHHLGACFLYFGLFPNDYEISVSKLIRMWIGEGFVEQELHCSLEETAEKYLEELINKNLVKSEKFKPDGRVKTCKVHDTLRDFCRTEAANINFLQEIKWNSVTHLFGPPIFDLQKYCRLSLHSKCLKFLSSKPSLHRVRSFVCFSDDKYVLSPENSTNIIGAFKLVRVLEVSHFMFTKIDSDMNNLLHLRYIALSSMLSVLPSKINQLRNLQTLIVDTTCRTLIVEADIWKMDQLRHFKTNASATLPKSTKSVKKSAELQTLGFISVESCTEELSYQAPNLKKLGIRGKLGLLFDGQNGSFKSLKGMKELGKLKLINDTYHNPQMDGGLVSLPQPRQFPPGLTRLTLCATSLSWKHMSTLGSLEGLEVLKLKDNAFSGSFWKADGGFPRLEVLHIEETDLIVWEASSHDYPKLRSLVLKYCEKLRAIPAQLFDIPRLQKLELYSCISAAKSAKDILDAKKQTQANFMLSIYPPL